jgi:hypothetical protein
LKHQVGKLPEPIQAMAKSSRIMRRSIGGEFGGNCLSHIVLDTPAPDFELADFDGKGFRLSDLHGSKNVLLVFNRGFT